MEITRVHSTLLGYPAYTDRCRISPGVWFGRNIAIFPCSDCDDRLLPMSASRHGRSVSVACFERWEAFLYQCSLSWSILCVKLAYFYVLHCSGCSLISWYFALILLHIIVVHEVALTTTVFMHVQVYRRMISSSTIW